MSQKLAAVKGMNDLLPGQIEAWQHVEATARKVFRNFGYSEVRTPILEDTALFIRGVGEETDIVGKEMYTFEDKAGRSLSLRPEGTAPAVRAYIEHAINNLEPVSHWFYVGPMFRYERMKTGRYRQFWQIGAEAFGVKEPAQDVEVIELVVRFLEGLGLEGISLNLNSLGDDACRPAYLQQLVAFLQAHREQLCAECQVRLTKNPLRVLDCKNPTCQALLTGAPSVLESLCGPCREHFEQVQAGLGRVGVRFQLNPRMVRGLDYYTRTAFEFLTTHPVLGTASAVGGGGRYDKLVKSLGGPEVPAVGFGLGLDRLCLLVAEGGKSFRKGPVVFVVAADEAAGPEVLRVVSELRRADLWVEFDARGGSLKSQMKRADKSGARYALVLGERELASGAAQLKPLAGGDVRQVALSELAGVLRQPA